MNVEFQAWPKTPRLFRDCIITEKIDGTNACVIVVPLSDVLPDGGVFSSTESAIEYAQQWCGAVDVAMVDGVAFVVAAQSRKRVITPQADNYDFAAWVHAHAQALATVLGPGYHYGEWWGHGIQRGYGLAQGDRRFSLFNVSRYGDLDLSSVPGLGVVPTITQRTFGTGVVRAALEMLKLDGSCAAPGFMRPEGIVVYHTAASQVFKVLIENDEQPKGAAG